MIGGEGGKLRKAEAGYTEGRRERRTGREESRWREVRHTEGIVLTKGGWAWGGKRRDRERVKASLQEEDGRGGEMMKN
jgi:hypothetical protein